MDTETRLYHNRLGCSKCQRALDLLKARGIDSVRIDLRVRPLSAPELADLIARLGVPARALLRTGEAEYTALGLDGQDVDDAQRIAAMAAYPQLIERPVFVHCGRAVIGRPPERVLELL